MTKKEKYKHPNLIKGLTGKEFAYMLSKLRYDALADIMGHLHDSIQIDAAKDKEKGREMLALLLGEVAQGIKIAEKKLDEIWEICEPRTETDEDIDLFE